MPTVRFFTFVSLESFKVFVKLIKPLQPPLHFEVCREEVLLFKTGVLVGVCLVCAGNVEKRLLKMMTKAKNCLKKLNPRFIKKVPPTSNAKRYFGKYQLFSNKLKRKSLDIIKKNTDFQARILNSISLNSTIWRYFN